MTDVIERRQVKSDLCDLMRTTQDTVASAASVLHAKTAGALILPHTKSELIGPDTDINTARPEVLYSSGFTNIYHSARFITIGDTNYQVDAPHRLTNNDPRENVRRSRLRHNRWVHQVIPDNEVWLGMYVAQPEGDVRRAVSTHGQVSTGEITRNAWGDLLERRAEGAALNAEQLSEAAQAYQSGIETALIVISAMHALRNVTVDVKGLEQLRAQWWEVAQAHESAVLPNPAVISATTYTGQHRSAETVLLKTPH